MGASGEVGVLLNERKRSFLKNICKILLMLFFSFQAYLGFYGIFSLYNFLNIGGFEKIGSEFKDFLIILPVIIEYSLISGILLLFISLFKPLKRFREKGLIYFLIRGLAVGLGTGSLGGILLFLIFSPGNIISLIIHLSTLGLIVSGVILGVGVGLISEFK